MADSKVSDLVTATSTGGSDLLYVVQSNTSKKVAISTLFANAGNVTLKGNVSFDTGVSVQLLAAPGIVNVSTTITHLSVDATGGVISLPAGKENQLKMIVMTASSGGTYTINSNIAGDGSVAFSSIGDSATLLYTNNKWFYMGGTATVV